jgi:hypothetical protein
VKARFVVATQVTAVGKERVVAIRLFDAQGNRLAGMQTEKAPAGEDMLPPVVARASLRLAAAGKIDKLPEPPKPAPAPEPEPVPPPPAPVVTPKPKPAPPESQTYIVVPPKPEPTPPPPAPAPRQDLDTPPAPIQGGQVTANQDIPDPNRLPAGVPTVKDRERRVGVAPRVGIVLAGLLFGGWTPLAIPVAGVLSTLLLLRAVDTRNTLRGRPHDTADIPGLVTRGRQFEIGGYVVLGVGAALLVYGAAVVTAAIVTAIVLP